jgi:hypothetical protein
MGKTNDLSDFERGIVVGARRTGLDQELQHCWVFHAQQSPVCVKIGPQAKGHPANLTQLGSIGVNPVERFQYLVESILRRVEGVLRAKGVHSVNSCYVFVY